MYRFAILLACSAGFFILLLSLFRTLTDVSELRTHYPRVIFDPRTEKADIEIVKQKPASWVSLKEVSPIAVAAIVISEDAAFWTHNGFDWSQMWDALETNLKPGGGAPSPSK
jgi:monofunctional biosynthetic peptidoglycan transglycosylase